MVSVRELLIQDCICLTDVLNSLKYKCGTFNFMPKGFSNLVK